MQWRPGSERELELACEHLIAGRAGLAGLGAAIRAGGDPLGEAFCRLRSPEERRSAGAFYTPQALVDGMLRWVLARSPGRVVDCGCGSGRFTVALRRGGFDGEIIAVDRDPLAVAMTRAQLAAAALPPARVLRKDFMDLELEAFDGVTAFVGNPPYLRHHELRPSTKARAREIAESLGLPLSGLAGLHVLFLLRIAAASRPGDIGCLVTSAEWLDTGYGAVARQLLAGPLGLRFLAVASPERRVFPDAMTTAAVFGWKVGSGDPAAVGRLRRAGDLEGLDAGRRLALAGLRSLSRWSEKLDRPQRGVAGGMVPLGTIARVHRGVATGHNGFFVLERGAALSMGLTPWLSPCLHRARLVQEAQGRVRADRCTHGLLCLPPQIPELPVLRDYLAQGELQGVHQRYLCRQRRHWWRLPSVGASAPIVATYMARRPPSFASNPDGCALLNVVHGLYPFDPLGDAQRDALVGWLNAHAHQLRGNRSYHGGLMKWEPRELESVLVPPLAALSSHT